MKAGEYPRLKLRPFAQIQERETSEAKYWKTFSLVREDRLQGAASSVHFQPVDDGSYLVTNSTRVSLYNAASDKVLRAFSRFADAAFSGRFRKDGKLLVAGEKLGSVKVFDVQTKSMLRQMKKHTMAVQSTVWTSDGLSIISGSDDKAVYRWDLGTEEVLWRSGKSAHGDYVRSVDASPVSADVFVSGCYDHAVRLWDSRQVQPILSFDHGHPLTTVMFSPSGSMLLSAGANEVKLWDVLAGKALHTFSNHQKHVTGICMDDTQSRVLSCGLDGHVKVYSLMTLQVVHGMKFGHPLNSIAMSGDGKKLVLGFVDGGLMVRNRSADEGRTAPSLSASASSGSGSSAMLTRLVTDSSEQMRSAQAADGYDDEGLDGVEGDDGNGNGSSRLLARSSSSSSWSSSVVDQPDARFYKGAGVAAGDFGYSADVNSSGTINGGGGGGISAEVAALAGISSAAANSQVRGGNGGRTGSNAAPSVVVETERSRSLQPYDKFLRKFSYGKALDAALKTRNPLVVLTVLEELCRRSGLSIALAGRDEQSLEPLMSFVVRYVSNPKYSRLIVQVVHKILDLYAGVLGHSDAIDELFAKLHRQVRSEVTFQRDVMRVMGSLDGIISAAMLSKQRPTTDI